MSKNDVLKTCPFCGSPGLVAVVDETNQYYPRCTGMTDKFCILTRRPDPEEDGFVRYVDAVEVWNRRPVKKVSR